MRTLDFADGQVPVIGQGTWHMGEQASERAREVNALRQGIDLGMTLIDSAEMYADGGAETIVGQAIAGRRDEVFLVSKVYPHNASRKGIPAACERSLKRMGVEQLDLYLLHWPGQHPLEETVEAFERLRSEGKIARWGVSNFDVADMQELNDPRCATNQVLYNPEERGIEFDLLPWSETQDLPLMAYCPIAQAGRLLEHPVFARIAEQRGSTAAQICLAWVVRQNGVVAIPKAVDPLHVKLNAAAGELQLSEEELRAIDQACPAPRRKQRLAMV